MIIASALHRLFTGLKAECTFLGQPVPVETDLVFWYGDQIELINWLNQRRGKKNYPLVWYIINGYYEYEGWYKTDATLYIIQDSQGEKLNDWRNEKNYELILEPVLEAVKDKLIRDQNVQVFGNSDERFYIYPEPKGELKKLNESIGNKGNSIDFIDALRVDFKMQIKCKCII
jgi:hypothetical protein